MQNILWHALLAVCIILVLGMLWYIQCIVHELGHLLFALLFDGHKPLRVRLYPVRWGDFAHCWWIETEIRPTAIDRLLSWLVRKKVLVYWDGGKRISPAIIAIFQLIILWVTTLFTSCPLLLAITFTFFPFGDILFFLYTVKWGSEKSDGQLFLSSSSKIPRILIL